MGLKETYRTDYRDSFVGNTALVTHIQCTNGDGQVFIKLAEKWTDIFNRWAPGEDEHLAFKALLTGEVPPEKENFLDEFSLEAIDEADMPAPFDKYFLPWKKVEEKFAKFHIEEYIQESKMFYFSFLLLSIEFSLSFVEFHYFYFHQSFH